MQSKDPYTKIKAGSRGHISSSYYTKSQRPAAIAAHRCPSNSSAHSQANGQNSPQGDTLKSFEKKSSCRTDKSRSRSIAKGGNNAGALARETP